MNINNSTLKFARSGSNLELSGARQLCFGCGKFGGEKITLYFEDFGSPGLVGKARSLAGRESLTVPICPSCQGRKRKLQLRTLTWSLIALGSIVLGLFVATLVTGGPEKKDFVFFIIMLSICFFPINKAGAVWKEKDRGGDLVILCEASRDSVSLEICSEQAYIKISEAMNGRP